MTRTISFCVSLLLLLLFALPTWSQISSVLTQHNDLSRTGANSQETILTPAGLNTSNFGKLFSIPVDGFVFAQPLYQPGVTMSDGKVHNVLYIATAFDSVYAVDADSGLQIWRYHLGTPVPASLIAQPGNQNILQYVGIISTPVIDPTTNTLYVVAKTLESNIQVFRIHALNGASGAEKLGGPILISATAPGNDSLMQPNNYIYDVSAGTISFKAAQLNQRAALTLVNGVVYVAFGSNGDIDDWHGWLIAYSSSTLTQLGVFNTTPNGARGAIWMAGQGLVADSQYNVYMMTANSANHDILDTALYVNGLPTFAQFYDFGPPDYGESFLKLSLTGDSFTVQDYFQPSNSQSLNQGDEDLGAGGPVLIPGTAYLVGAGKSGMLFVANTAPNQMGKFETGPGGSDGIYQEFQATTGYSNQNLACGNPIRSGGCGYGLWGSPVFWNNTLYIWGANDVLRMYAFNATSKKFNTSPSYVSNPASPGTPNGDTSGALSISASGTSDGIIWATIPTGDPSVTTVGGILYAFDATNVSIELWNSREAASLRDDFANFAKFVPPTIANGKVYVATDAYQVCVFGTNPPVPAWHHNDIVANDVVISETPASQYPTVTVGTAPTANGDPAAFVFSTGDVGSEPTENVVYRDANTSGGTGTGHVQLLTSFANQAQWSNIDLTVASGAPPTAGNPFGYAFFNGPTLVAQNVIYRAANNHVYIIYLPKGNSTWLYEDLTAMTGATVATGDPFGYQFGSSQVIAFVGSDAHVHQLYTTNNNTEWVYADLTTLTGSANASGNTNEFAFAGAAQIVAVRATSGDILELSFLNSQWLGSDITALSGAPSASSNPAAYATNGYQFVNYRGTDNHIHQISSSSNSGPWSEIDLTTLAAAPNAVGNPSGSVFPTQTVAYRGSDSAIHQLYPYNSRKHSKIPVV